MSIESSIIGAGFAGLTWCAHYVAQNSVNGDRCLPEVLQPVETIAAPILLPFTGAILGACAMKGYLNITGAGDSFDTPFYLIAGATAGATYSLVYLAR